MSDLIYSDVHRKMIVHIMHTANWLDSKISYLLKGFDLTHVQFNILKVLEAEHPKSLSVGQVKAGLLFSNSDMTRLMDRLVKKDLVVRNVCPENRRQIDVEITGKGLKLLNNIAPELINILDDYFIKKIKDDEAVFISEKMKLIRN